MPCKRPATLPCRGKVAPFPLHQDGTDQGEENEPEGKNFFEGNEKQRVLRREKELKKRGTRRRKGKEMKNRE
jgi:hypothetical protein